MAVGALGAAMVVYATGQPGQPAGPGLKWGVLLAGAAPIVSAFGTATQIPAERIRRSGADGRPVAVQSASIAAFWLGRAIAAPIVLALGYLESDGGLLGRSEFWLAVAVGALVHAPATIATRIAMCVTTVRRVVAAQYCSPVLALLWLVAFWDVDVGNAWLLAAGTAAIAAANTALAAGRFAPAPPREAPRPSRRQGNRP